MLSSPNIKPVETNQPFYGKYQYSIKFSVPELGVIRGLNYDKIDQIVADRNRWREEHKIIYASYRRQEITPEITQQLKKVCKTLIKHQDRIKFVISYDTGYVYADDINIINEISWLSCISNVSVKQAVLVSPPGTIALKDPKWTHRTYFRSVVVTESSKKMLVEYLHGRENVRLSPGLIYWAKHTNTWNNWTQNYYFIDHNNDGEILFLNMVVPRITGRTLTIVAK